MIDQKAANYWAAKVIPAILVAIIAYSSYVVIAQVCVGYLLSPGPSGSRLGAAVIVLFIHFALVIVVTATYIRILHVIAVDPGYVPRGRQYYERRANLSQKDHRRRRGKAARINVRRLTEKNERKNKIPHTGDDQLESSADIEGFYQREVFVCEGDGRPRWCSMCMNWKPDRTHHCSEIGRCVRKMDHFCPWVGGIVSETNFKFFIQFTAYAGVLCVFVLIILAVFISESQGSIEGVNVHWIVTIVIAGLFGIFALGMTATSLQFAFVNSTSVENLTRTVKVWTLAIHLTRPPSPDAMVSYRTVTYPNPDLPQAVQRGPPRTFAILHSKPGQNPFDLGWRENFKSVMGNSVLDWVLPVKYSPCCDHRHQESQFAFGPVLEQMKEAAGLTSSTSPNIEKKGKRRRSGTGTHSRTGDRRAMKRPADDHFS